MIISHSHKYIFIKSLKTAGTSIEAALSHECSGQDVVTRLGNYRFNRDESGGWIHNAMNDEGFEQHEKAAAIKEKVPPAVWSDYYKFSVVRNPWDRIVSDFFWRNRRDPSIVATDGPPGSARIPRERFEQTARTFRDFVRRREWRTNDQFYSIDGKLCVDFVIKYENLQGDLEEVCRRLMLTIDSLPRLKTGFRAGNRHYSEFYDDETKGLVADMHEIDLKHFGYRFEK